MHFFHCRAAFLERCIVKCLCLWNHFVLCINLEIEKYHVWVLLWKPFLKLFMIVALYIACWMKNTGPITTITYKAEDINKQKHLACSYLNYFFKARYLLTHDRLSPTDVLRTYEWLFIVKSILSCRFSHETVSQNFGFA